MWNPRSEFFPPSPTFQKLLRSRAYAQTARRPAGQEAPERRVPPGAPGSAGRPGLASSSSGAGSRRARRCQRHAALGQGSTLAFRNRRRVSSVSGSLGRAQELVLRRVFRGSTARRGPAWSPQPACSPAMKHRRQGREAGLRAVRTSPSRLRCSAEEQKNDPQPTHKPSIRNRLFFFFAAALFDKAPRSTMATVT